MAAQQFKYPEVRRSSHTDSFFGQDVADPYRWLEDIENDEGKKFIEEQNQITTQVLNGCDTRQNLFDLLKKYQNYPKYTTPFKRGDNYFYWYNSGLQNQLVLYKQASLKDEGKIFLDPNTLSTDGTASIGNAAFSQSGKYMAYSVHRSGSDWKTFYIKNVETGEDLADKLEWIKFSSVSWKPDESGLFYCRYPKPEKIDDKDEEFKRGTETQATKKMKVYYHKLGDKQEDDVLIFSEGPDEWMFSTQVTDDGKYMILSISESCDPSNRVFFFELDNIQKNSSGSWIPNKFIDDFDGMYSFLTNDGSTFYFHSDKNAPKYKIISCDVKAPFKLEDCKVVIAEKEDANMQDVVCAGNHFVLNYLKDVQETLSVYTMEGKYVGDLEQPGCGSIGVSGKRNQDELFYIYSGFTNPGRIYHYDFNQKKSTIFREIKIEGLDLSEFETEQVFYESHDKVKIPMFINRMKGTPKDGKNPTLLYGYGGFNISLTPFFAVSRILWMKHLGGVYVLANLRGGNEYGESWHQQGILDRKQNVFEDFKYAGRYLIENKFTQPSQLGIMGGSNGGLLVAACLNQNPELFGAAVCQVPVTDMLRFHKFTIGYAWTSDYGCADKEKDFQFLIKYSPVHTVPENKRFPALMVTTADHDDRVVPLHSFKYIAEVQHKLGSKTDQPLCIRIDVKAGHGHGKPLEKQLEEAADTWGFLAKYLSAQWKQ